MSMPLVSITSAFHNEERYLPDLIRAVFAQTLTDWELILLDDGSTDRSLEIAQSVKDPRVRVYSNGRNLGRSASLNKLTELARGKYIARQDADDLCSPTRIEKQVVFMEAHPEIDAAGTGVCFLDKNDQPMGEHIPVTSHEAITASPARGLHIAHGTILGRRSWFDQRRYNETLRIAVDFEMLFHASAESRFANLPEVLYYYRFDQSFSLRKQLRTRLANCRFLFHAFWQQRHYAKALGQVGLQLAKHAITTTLFVVGLRSWLLARRGKFLPPDRRAFYESELATIRACHVPGLITSSPTPVTNRERSPGALRTE